MQLSEATREQLQAVIDRLQSRLAATSSKWMKDVIRKDIAVIQAELDSRKS